MKYTKAYESPTVTILSAVHGSEHAVLVPIGDRSWRSHKFDSWYEAQQFAYQHDDKVILAQSKQRASLLTRLEKIKFP